jgi:hypothetical protein
MGGLESWDQAKGVYTKLCFWADSHKYEQGYEEVT